MSEFARGGGTHRNLHSFVGFGGHRGACQVTPDDGSGGRPSARVTQARPRRANSIHCVHAVESVPIGLPWATTRA